MYVKIKEMKESYLYKKLEGEEVQCKTCAHYCILGPGERGKCGVRENKKGTLFALNYGLACALHTDPVEKKPLFHFLPGTSTLSLATVGCNFRCSNCQNWEISQTPRLRGGQISGENISPEEIVKKAVEEKIPSISYTYTEPTVFLEYGLDTMKMAKKEGLKNIWVTNGFLSKETLELIAPYLDGANVDLKSFNNEFYREHCGAQLDPVLDTLKEMKRKNIHLEITTLVIPTLTDDAEMLKRLARFIKEELGLETPWHISRFSAVISWKLDNLPDTSVQKLKNIYQLAKKEGLKYVYTGNLPGVETEDTFCPECGEKVIDRSGYLVKRRDDEGRCPNCGVKIPIITK